MTGGTGPARVIRGRAERGRPARCGSSVGMGLSARARGGVRGAAGRTRRRRVIRARGAGGAVVLGVSAATGYPRAGGAGPGPVRSAGAVRGLSARGRSGGRWGSSSHRGSGVIRARGAGWLESRVRIPVRGLSARAERGRKRHKYGPLHGGYPRARGAGSGWRPSGVSTPGLSAHAERGDAAGVVPGLVLGYPRARSRAGNAIRRHSTLCGVIRARSGAACWERVSAGGVIRARGAGLMPSRFGVLPAGLSARAARAKRGWACRFTPLGVGYPRARSRVHVGLGRLARRRGYPRARGSGAGTARSGAGGSGSQPGCARVIPRARARAEPGRRRGRTGARGLSAHARSGAPIPPCRWTCSRGYPRARGAETVVAHAAADDEGLSACARSGAGHGCMALAAVAGLSACAERSRARLWGGMTGSGYPRARSGATWGVRAEVVSEG